VSAHCDSYPLPSMTRLNSSVERWPSLSQRTELVVPVRLVAGLQLYRAKRPQQVTLPSVLRPHVKLSPALSWEKVPAGGVDWP
jgi:hypothetical protein